MSFPDEPLDVLTELYVNGEWIDITDDVYTRDGISITRGIPNESSDANPASVRLTINNSSGAYSPRNPLGPYYGSLGRNTPIRLSVGLARDSFNRTVVDGWGTADTGQTWGDVFGSGGTVADSDYAVATGSATIAVPQADAARYILLSSPFRDAEIAFTFTLSPSSIDGAEVTCEVVFRHQVSGGYRLRLAFRVDEGATATVFTEDGRQVGDFSSALFELLPAGSYTGQMFRVRAQIEAATIRAKLWVDGDPEPCRWMAEITDTEIEFMDSGQIGIGVVTGLGNANAPITLTVHSVELRSPRINAEVSSWPPRWDITESDAYVPIDAAGILRRLGQPTAPLWSAMRFGYSQLAENAPLVYYPCEDGSGSSVISAGLATHLPMEFTGQPEFATYQGFQCSAPLPKVSESSWLGLVPSYAETGESQVRWLMNVPSTGDVDGAVILATFGTGTCRRIEVYLSGTGGNLGIRGFSPDGVQLFNSSSLGLSVNGVNKRYSLELTQDGADIDWVVRALLVGSSTTTSSSGTLASATFGRITHIRVNPNSNLNEVAIGHLSLQAEIDTLDDLFQELNAFTGESAGRRIERLCQQNGVSFGFVGDLDDTEEMGPQPISQTLSLINECVSADRGILFEPRSDLGLMYRTRKSRYNQTPTLVLDHDAGQLAPPFEPVDDDRYVANDITVKRVGGSEARVVQEGAPLSVCDPAMGGAGRYAVSETVNVETDGQILGIAGWLLHLGTVDEIRYPSISVNLADSDVVADPAVVDGALSLNVGDRLVVNNPPATLAWDAINQLAFGLTEELGPYTHAIRVNCAPASPFQVLTLDSPDARLGSDASTLAADVDSSTTTLTVAIEAGSALWTTSAGQMPVPIQVGGEEMSVTAVSGSSSPQTFTVTRSVNGVIKAHSAGARVLLARRATVAL